MIGLTRRLAACFTDARDPALIEHDVEALVMQRVVGIALGYEDLIDHDQLRHDPVLATLAGKLAARRSDCAPLAGKSTLNRLELSRPEPTRYAKLAADPETMQAMFVDLFLDSHGKAPKQIALDLDATDDPLHGHQGEQERGRRPRKPAQPVLSRLLRRLLLSAALRFCGRHRLAAKLLRSNVDAAAGSVEEIGRIVAQIRARWARVRTLLRADSGFAREALMAWCEANWVDFLFGLARNGRLAVEIEAEMGEARSEAEATGKPARRFRDFTLSTLDRWSRTRCVIGNAEWTGGEANPRFVVTSLKPAEAEARQLCETIYCARGEMENRIKECQLDLFADRSSAATMRANQLRLVDPLCGSTASAAYVLICALHRIGLAHTQFTNATCGTIRLKLLKIGALVQISVRRVAVAMASSHSWQYEWALAHALLRRAGA